MGRAFSRERNAPQQYNATAIKIVDHVNALVGGFDYGAGFAFGMELTTATGPELKGYEFYARALGSSRLYRSGELGARVGTNKTRGEFWFNYTRRTKDDFFDLGSLSAATPRTDFASERRSYNGLFARKFMRMLEGGLYGSFSSTGSSRGDDNRFQPIDTLFSGNPNVTPATNFLPGLQQNVRLVSYGVFAEVDLRNNERGLTRGGYFYGRFGSVDAVDSGNAFSDFGWNETELDGRVYIPVFSKKTSVALRGCAVLRDPKGGSQIPFYDQAYFGGRTTGRGFNNFRFRGNNSVLYSGEIRQTIWSMNDENTKGLDIVAFGDVGQVWGDNRSNTDPTVLRNDNFDSRNYRTGFGGGIQYRLSKRVAFRVEIGASNERTLSYFGLRPGF
jgi:outer membrane protein assembly factor BamA